MEHSDAIEWPNGEGFTPCTHEYAEICDRMDAIKPDYLNLDDLSPADYNEFCTLSNLRDEMMMSGHVGKSHRY